MSLCIVFADNNNILACADSRVSFTSSDEIHYLVHDDFVKIRQYGDKVIFMDGNLDVVTSLFNQYYDDDTIETIVKKIKTVFKQNESILKKIKPEDEGDDLGVYIFTVENKTPVMYQVFHTDKWIVDRQEITASCIKTLGAYSREAAPYAEELYYQNSKRPAPEIILETYEHFSDELVGGYIHSYLITLENINRDVPKKIRDKKPLKRLDFRMNADMQGNAYVSSINISGNSLLTGTKSKFNLSDNTFRLGTSDTDFKMKFDGNNLSFSEDVKIQFKGEKGDRGATGPQGADGNPGSYYAPSWVGSTGITGGSVSAPTLLTNYLQLGANSNAIKVRGCNADNSITSAIMAGKDSYGSTTAGFWMGYDSGWKFKIGNDKDYFSWDGTNIKINGDFYTYDESGSLVGKLATEGIGAGAAAYLQLNNTKTGVEAFKVYADLSNGGNQTFVDSSFSVRAGSGSSYGSINLQGGKAQTLLNSDLGWLTHPLIYQYDAANTNYPFVIGKEKAIFLTQNVGIGITSPSYKLHVNGTGAATQWTANSISCYHFWLAQTAEPSNPNNGQMYFDGTNLKIRINGTWRNVSTS